MRGPEGSGGEGYLLSLAAKVKPRVDVPVIAVGQDQFPAFWSRDSGLTAPLRLDDVAAIADLKARGLKVTLCPFILMDVPPGNTLPNPYSENAANPGQPAFPWRGRITCSPAAGYTGSVDKTATAAGSASGTLAR